MNDETRYEAVGKQALEYAEVSRELTQRLEEADRHRETLVSLAWILETLTGETRKEMGAISLLPDRDQIQQLVDDCTRLRRRQIQLRDALRGIGLDPKEDVLQADPREG